MGRKSKLKELRRLAERTTKHLPEYVTKSSQVKTLNTMGTVTLGECTKGAYKALKRNRVKRVYAI